MCCTIFLKMDVAKDIESQISRLERELRDSLVRVSPVHSTPMPQFPTQSDSGVITMKPIGQPAGNQTTQLLQTPVNYTFKPNSGTRPKDQKQDSVVGSSKIQLKMVI